MDFDPRDFDSRDDERQSQAPSRRDSSRSSDRERDDNWRQPETRTRDRDDDGRLLGRGPGNDRQGSDQDARNRDHDPRWDDRDRDSRERDRETGDTFTRHVHLPRGPERELVRDRDREYTLRGSESRTLATVGAFRVISSRDLRDHDGSPADPRSGDLRYLREQGLIEIARVPGYRDAAVVLTKEGRSLLESHRDCDQEHHQRFYAGLARERELEHDLQVYRVYEQTEARLLGRGAHVERVLLDHELKSEYLRPPFHVRITIRAEPRAAPTGYTRTPGATAPARC